MLNKCVIDITYRSKTTWFSWFLLLGLNHRFKSINPVCCTLETGHWLWLGCWSNNVANCHLSPGTSTAEYCAPACCQNAHTRLIALDIDDALQIVTGCLRPTPADNLPTLAGIQSAELRHNGATLSLARCVMETGHLLHSALTCPSSTNARHLKSRRHPFVPATQLIS